LADAAIPALLWIFAGLVRFLFIGSFASLRPSLGSKWIVVLQTSSMSRTQHPIDLIEEAIHLLRRAPIETFALFLVAIAPFVLCFFQFCSEMSYSEFAGSKLPGFASTLALSYLWMKAFQYLACRQLVMVYTGELSNRGDFGRILRSCIHQAAIHPIGLFAKPMAVLASIPGFLTFVPLLMLPASIIFSFFQNASILITGERGDFAKCWHLSVNRGRTAASLLFLSLFLRIVIFLNIYLTIGILPYLVKALFGIDTFLSRDFRWLLSFSYLVGIGLISYFVVDLLIKAIQVIEVCRAEARTTGKDLQRSLMSLTAAKGGRVGSPFNLLVLVCLIIPTLSVRAEGGRFRLRLFVSLVEPAGRGYVGQVRRPETTQDFRRAYHLCFVVPPTARDASLAFLYYRVATGGSSALIRGESPLIFANYPIILASLKRASPPPEADRIPDSELNQRIDRELSGSEYSWRKAQHHLVAGEKNWVQSLGAWIAKSLGKVSRAINRLVDTITKWWKSLFPNPEGPTPFSATGAAPNWINQLLLYAIICGLTIATALIVLRILGRSRKKKPVPVGPPISVTPNLESEITVADELPEDQWLLLARRKLEEGEPRLALRAIFLAVLSLLGTQRLIIVRHSKSNSDYEAELRRRRSAELTELFRGNRRLFERCWYGDHPVTEVEIEQSTSFYQRLKHACLAEK
jgi:hypothetical protein